MKQALAIDPNSAEAYSSQGFIRFWYDWDWAGAEASLQACDRAQSQPGRRRTWPMRTCSPTSVATRKPCHRHARRWRWIRCRRLINTLTAAFIAGAGHAEERSATSRRPWSWIRISGSALLAGSGCKMQQHDYAGAIADLRRARDLSGDSSQVLTVLGQVYVLAGERGAAEQVLRDMQATRS